MAKTIPTRKMKTTPRTMPTIPPAGTAGLEAVAPLIPPLVDTEAEGLGGEVVLSAAKVESGVLDGMLVVEEVLEGRGSKVVELEDSGRVGSAETVKGSESVNGSVEAVEGSETVKDVESGATIMEVGGIEKSVTEVGVIMVCVIVNVNGPGMFSPSSARRFPWRARTAEERC